jgi:peroxiredoxin
MTPDRMKLIMKLDQQLAAYKAEFTRTAPAGRPALYDAKVAELRASFAVENAIGVDDYAPDFSLPNAAGEQVGLEHLLLSGPVVIAFYRGGWCPYCNIQLRAYQEITPRIAEHDARLVAISPQLPDGSLDTAQKNALTFDVLSDVGNHVAREFGLVYTVPHELQAVFRSVNKPLPGINGDESWQLPVPATYVVAQDRRITLAYLDVDYRRRLEPGEILRSLDALRRG